MTEAEAIEGTLLEFEPAKRKVFEWPVIDPQGLPQIGVHLYIVLDQVATWAIAPNGALEVLSTFGGQFVTKDPTVIARWTEEWEIV